MVISGTMEPYHRWVLNAGWTENRKLGVSFVESPISVLVKISV